MHGGATLKSCLRSGILCDSQPANMSSLLFVKIDTWITFSHSLRLWDLICQIKKCDASTVQMSQWLFMQRGKGKISQVYLNKKQFGVEKKKMEFKYKHPNETMEVYKVIIDIIRLAPDTKK